MQEQIAEYSGNKRRSWLTNKCQGVVNRYFNARRNLLWRLHLLQHPIGLDETKLLPGSMPVFINNYNRLAPLRTQLDWLRKVKDPVSIIIVDNGSDYSPLLSFYDCLELPNVQVVQLGYNSWRKGVAHLSKQLKDFEKFIITDPDLIPYTSTPDDILSHLSILLDRYPTYNHIGLSLEINDLPENALREKVRRHERQFWPPATELLNEEVYVAAVDTTFAMYRRRSKVEALAPALRTVRPYTLRHLDWYIQPSNVSEEYLYYLQSVKPVATWSVEIKKFLGLFSRHRPEAT